MTDDIFMRRVLLLSAGFNLLGGLLFAFPGFPTGRLAGLPGDVPGLYRATVFLFVVLFGGMYAWLARRPRIDRPMVAFGAIGKASFFALVLLFWWAGALPGRTVWLASGDAILAGVFALWLYTSRHDAAAPQAIV
jgi:hypothetical protein